MITPLERAFRDNASLYWAQAEMNEELGLHDAADECLGISADFESAANALRDMRAEPPTMQMFQPS